jgi:signal peptidase I
MSAKHAARMFFLTPRHVKQGRQFVKDSRKLLAYKRDIWSTEVVADVGQHIEKLEDAVQSKDKARISETAQQLDTLLGKHLPAPTDAWLRENVEVFLVAITVALGVRTFFLQPFIIPTGSMQPTLNGIIGYPTTEPPPNPLVQIFDRAFLGKRWVDIVAKDDEALVDVKERTGISIKGGFGWFTHCAITTDKNQYIVDAPRKTVEEFLAANPVARSGRFKKGEVIARGHFDSGDMVFVDKISYHFRKPSRGEVFVFNTQGIPTNENKNQSMVGPSQYYIKRLAGTPGDELRINQPELYINGAPAQEPGFRRVIEMKEPDYRGYANGQTLGFRSGILATPADILRLGAHEYFALGDNSYHSSDGRDWGTVPQENIMGRGLFVYWPFSKHWGLIR